MLQHIVEHHGETLLPHFLGLFRVNVSDKDHYILLTRNVQSYLSEMHETYDLKVSIAVDLHLLMTTVTAHTRTQLYPANSQRSLVRVTQNSGRKQATAEPIDTACLRYVCG